jgi:hypothetical protein
LAPAPTFGTTPAQNPLPSIRVKHSNPKNRLTSVPATEIVLSRQDRMSNSEIAKIDTELIDEVAIISTKA